MSNQQKAQVVYYHVDFALLIFSKGFGLSVPYLPI